MPAEGGLFASHVAAAPKRLEPAGIILILSPARAFRHVGKLPGLQLFDDLGDCARVRHDRLDVPRWTSPLQFDLLAEHQAQDATLRRVNEERVIACDV